MAAYSYAVSVEADVFIARQAAERQATAEGFTRLAAQEVALIVSEGGDRGSAARPGARDPGLGPAAADRRPRAGQRDGHTASGPIPPDAMLRRRGIGCGLGAVARLGDRLLQELSDPGKVLVVTRYRVRPRPPPG